MERDQAVENSWYPDLETEEPHFDDERTLLSAQPVVPLAAVSQTRNRRLLMFVGAFVVAALLGAGVALALVRVRQPVVVRSTTDTNPAGATEQQPVAQASETDTPNGEASSEVQQAENADATTATASVTEQNKRPKSRTVRRSSEPRMKISLRPADQALDDGEPRLIDQWQERRQRRVNPKPDNHHRSDLFRIREIFEGPRPSRRSGN